MVSGRVKPAFRSLSLQRLLSLQRHRERHFHLAAPLRARLAFLVDRDPFGQPARHPLIRHLQRDDVRQLVPQRRLPGERARVARLRRIHRDDAAEAGAERADHAGQAERADGEVVVFGKISIRIGPFGVNWYFADSVFSASCASGIAYSRITGASSGWNLTIRSPLCLDDELVERVEQRQQVVGDLVERVGVERALERLARFGLVAGAHQVHAEIAVGAGVRGIERDGAGASARPLRRTGSSARPDRRRRGTRRRRPGLIASTRLTSASNAGRIVAHVGDRRQPRSRVEMRRVDLEHRLNLRARVVVLGVVEIELGEQQVRVGELRVDLERAPRRGGGGRRVLVGQHAGQRRRAPAPTPARP